MKKTYLPVQFPIFWEELRRRQRGERGFMVLLAYTLILILLLSYAAMTDTISNDPHYWPNFGRMLWMVFFFGQLAIIAFISPGMTASSISGEMEQQTFEFLLITRMNSNSIVIGKFFGAIGQMIFILLASLPIIAVVFFFGGVAPLDVVLGYVFIIVTGIFFASLGFLASCVFRRVVSAVVWAYGFVFILIVVIPAGMTLLYRDVYMVAVNFFVLNPFVVAVQHFVERGSPSHLFLSLPMALMIYLAIAALALLESIMIVRRLRGLSKRFIPRIPRKPVRASEMHPDQSMSSVELADD